MKIRFDKAQLTTNNETACKRSLRLVEQEAAALVIKPSKTYPSENAVLYKIRVKK